jgi:hypothetical protein
LGRKTWDEHGTETPALALMVVISFALILGNGNKGGAQDESQATTQKMSMERLLAGTLLGVLSIREGTSVKVNLLTGTPKLERQLLGGVCTTSNLEPRAECLGR